MDNYINPDNSGEYHHPGIYGHDQLADDNVKTALTVGQTVFDATNQPSDKAIPPGLQWLYPQPNPTPVPEAPAPCAVEQALEPDIAQAERFLELLDEEAEQFTFQAFDDDKERKKAGEEAAKARGEKYIDPYAKVFHGTLGEHAGKLTELNKNRVGVFATINRTTLNGSRNANNIIGIRAFFVDLDGAPLGDVMKAPLPPQMVVESGGFGRYHAYWMVEGAPVDRDIFRAVQKHLIQRFNSDQLIHDLPRVMRLPGFFHCKAKPVMTRITDESGEQPYQFEQFIRAFGIDLSAAAQSTSKSTPVVPVTPGVVDHAVFVRVREIALRAARRTIDDARIGRHGEIYKGGSYMRRDGLRLTPETATAFLKTFEENMRPTDTAGVSCGLNWDAEMKTLNDGYYRPSERDRPGTTKAEAEAIAAGLAAVNGMVVDPETGEILQGVTPQGTPSKAFPLDGGEAEQLVTWAIKTGRKLPKRNDWPRVWLDCGHHTAPFTGLMANCGSYDQFMPAVERYIPIREANVERKNQERIAKGEEPAPDINGDVIRLKAEEFLERIMAIEVSEDLGRELLRKLDANGDKRQIRLLSTHELDALPAPSYRIKHVLPATGLGAIWGPPGSGKTFLILDAAFGIAAGRQWFGHRVKQAPVVYCALEGEGGIQARVRAYRRRHGNDRMENVRFLVERFNLRSEDDRQALIEAIKEVGFENPVIVLDTLNRAAPGADENSSADMGTIIDGAKQIQDALGGLVLLVHHSGKNAASGLRGHSSLLAALDVAIEVSRDGDARKWTLAKSKDGEDGNENAFSLETVEIGIDEDGDAVTTCVVVGAGDTSDSKDAVPSFKAMNKDAEMMLKRLVIVTHQLGVPPNPFSLGPEHKVYPEKIIAWDALRSAFKKCDHSGESSDKERQSWKRGREELLNRKAICAYGDFVWVNPENNDMVISMVIMDANHTIQSAGIESYGAGRGLVG
ncbi:AAA family ATPase [Methylocaldum sp.]|uniref:AAA family ATPase n=1 Tax=Methylocaldum sp. TaxID=1969727 RepID=UPI002D2CFAF9|nr:AAA family ATPase [Methylocaldum sp.]HYE35667.1 AAA family ATPase [Methylocaldum sp.]